MREGATALQGRGVFSTLVFSGMVYGCDACTMNEMNGQHFRRRVASHSAEMPAQSVQLNGSSTQGVQRAGGGQVAAVLTAGCPRSVLVGDGTRSRLGDGM